MPSAAEQTAKPGHRNHVPHKQSPASPRAERHENNGFNRSPTEHETSIIRASAKRVRHIQRLPRHANMRFHA